MRRRRHGENKRGLGIIVLVVMLICGIVSYKRIELNDEYNAKKAKEASVQKDIKKQEKEQESLEEEKAYVQTKKYIEEVAREKLGLVYEDEIIFKAEE